MTAVATRPPRQKLKPVATVVKQMLLDLQTEIIVDLFAGGGGVSEGIEMALGLPPHVAVNHSDAALSMHRVNHPFTRHFIADVFEIDPRWIVDFLKRMVGALHLSPDCTHHSQASSGQPRDKKIRALSWVALRWAGTVRPRVITLENVKQILKWGPLIAKRDPETGRVIKLVTEIVDGKEKTRQVVAEPGERVPVQQQFLIPDRKREGQTWRRFVRTLESKGYKVEIRQIVAAELGAGTTRERLYMIARCDGRPIVWPEATHAKIPAKGQKPWKTAAECIDWSIECPSIFTRKKPLAPATLRRIAKGVQRYVLEAADPFIVPIAHYNGSDIAQAANEPLRTIKAATKGGEFSLVAPTIVPATHQGADRVYAGDEPLRTVTAAHRGELMLASSTLVGVGGPEYAGKPAPLDVPLGTALTENHRAIASAYLMQANGGKNTNPGHELGDPVSAITSKGSQQQLVTAFLARQFGNSIGQPVKQPAPTTTAGGGGKTELVVGHLAHLRGNCDARDPRDPLHTISAGGQHHAVVEYRLSPEDEAGALRVAAFLIQYYSEGGQWGDLRKPLSAITTRDRLALVTVTIQGTPYVIVDIGLRMLTPRELYRAQGFRDDYIIDHGHDGRKFTKEEQVRMVGNSVPPDVICAIYRANLPELAVDRRAA